MNKDELHDYATRTTPEEIYVPNTWPALFVWAVGKFGGGVIFLVMLIYVYTDFRESNSAMVRVVSANAEAIYAMANEIRETNRRIERLQYRRNNE